MDENKETRKGIPPKGCLLMLACIFLGAACIGLSVWLDNLFSKKRYLYGYNSYGRHHCRRVSNPRNG